MERVNKIKSENNCIEETINKEDNIEYSHEWKRFQREWSRPAIVRSKLKDIK